MKGWLRQHLLALIDALKHIAGSGGNFTLNVLVVAIAMALPFAGLTLLENTRPVSERLSVQPEISIFMAMDTPRERTHALAGEIREAVSQSGGAATLTFISRENALTQLQTKSGLSEAIVALGENPLPDAYVLKLREMQNQADADRVETIAAQLKALPGVEYVQIDSAWVKRLAALMHILRLALLFLGTTLGVVVVAVVFNTIRLQVMTQREEIEVSRMLGATDAYIYRPFYYTGALLGLAAGVVALGLVLLTLYPLNDAIANFARLYASEFRLAPPPATTSLALLAISAGLGMLGALLSVKRHLARAS